LRQQSSGRVFSIEVSSLATVEIISGEFERVHRNLIEVLDIIPEDKLYWKPFGSRNFIRVYSCGELISHIGGSIEYVFNGITTNFWEEPFEWITREALPTRSHIAAYLEETARVRRLAFSELKDEDLSKRVYFPDCSSTTIGEILIRTLTHICHHRGQVYAYVHLLSDARLPSIGSRIGRGG
jgi:uncharacterized damage-inducible protein DinB